MNPFETETMADLCLRQGHRGEALAIYRRLEARTAEADTRERMRRRVADIESTNTVPPSHLLDTGAAADAGRDAPLIEPGIRTRWAGSRVTIEWRLPADTTAPALEVLLIKTGPNGVVIETRTFAVDQNTGHLAFDVTDLHSARAAAGRRGARGFVPLVRD